MSEADFEVEQAFRFLWSRPRAGNGGDTAAAWRELLSGPTDSIQSDIS
jgi:hypothetical protein